MNMGQNTMAVDEKILFQTLAPLLEKKFNDRLCLSEVEIAQEKHLFFALHIDPQVDREALLQEAELELEHLLRKRFGYKRPFTVRVDLPN